MTARYGLTVVGIILLVMFGYQRNEVGWPSLASSDQVAAVVVSKPHLKQAPATLTLSARAFLALAVLPDGQAEVVVEKRSDEPLPIASISKLMTALLVVNNYDLDLPLTVRDGDLDGPVDPGQFKPGQTFVTGDLLRSLLIESSNWSAQVLADAAGRGQFVAAMNEQAAALDLQHTHYVNPSGLDEAVGPVNYSTARDLAFLAREILKQAPQIFDTTRQTDQPLADARGHFHHQLISTDKLLGADLGGWEIVGGKTGQTDLARKNLVLVLRDPRTGSYLINVVLGSADHFADMQALSTWVSQTYEF